MTHANKSRQYNACRFGASRYFLTFSIFDSTQVDWIRTVLAVETFEFG